MDVDHLADAERAFHLAGLNDPPRDLTQVFVRYLIPLLERLPVAEKAGFVRSSQGAENTAIWGNTYVRISRICYSDGSLYKVMFDAPNGGPEWVHEEDGRTDLYVPYVTEDVGADEPVDQPFTFEQRILARIDAQFDRLWLDQQASRDIAAAHHQELMERINSLAAGAQKSVSAAMEKILPLLASREAAKATDWPGLIEGIIGPKK